MTSITKGSVTLTRERLKGILSYDPITGDWIWLVQPLNHRVQIGDKAGCDSRKGNAIYRFIGIDGEIFASHRLAFLYMLGHVPPLIDHIDGNASNNAWGNLREATHQQNNQNRRLTKPASGHKNICRVKGYDHWRIVFYEKGRRIVDLGMSDFDVAVLIAAEWRDKLHGKFARAS